MISDTGFCLSHHLIMNPGDTVSKSLAGFVVFFSFFVHLESVRKCLHGN